MQSWWAAPIGRAVGYGAFGGLAAGALIRRTIPAMVITFRRWGRRMRHKP